MTPLDAAAPSTSVLQKRSREEACLENDKVPKENSVTPADKQKQAIVVHAKHISEAVLETNDRSVVKLESLRGNYWKTMGHTNRGINLLYLEEALYLLEKHQLRIQDNTSVVTTIPVTSSNNDTNGNSDAGDSDKAYFTLRQFYEHVVSLISLECYLTFVKLKNLDYVVHRSGSEVRSFGEEAEVIGSFRQHLQAHRRRRTALDCQEAEPNLLDFMSSFDIYLIGDNYTKRNAAAGINQPVAHVIVTSCPKLYSSKLMLTLLKQSKQTPCLFAIVMPHSGFVMLEEMTDAALSLSWDFGTMSSNSVNINKTIGKEDTTTTTASADTTTIATAAATYYNGINNDDEGGEKQDKSCEVGDELALSTVSPLNS